LDTRINSKAFQKFAQAAGTIVNPEVEKWKDQGVEFSDTSVLPCPGN